MREKFAKVASSLLSENFHSRMCGYKASSKGFTLIEMLIVIAVIGVLATFTVSSFSSYRKSAVLDLAKQNIASLIDEVRAKTINGRSGSDGEPVCFGLYFKSGEYGVWRVQWPYDPRDYYNEILKEYKTGRCDLSVNFNDAKVLKDFVSFRNEVLVSSVLAAGETQDRGEALFLYLPPLGAFVDTFSSGPLKKSSVSILLSATSAVRDKEIRINLDSGQIAKND